ncbi:MAG: DUF2236 domain-containing protein [Myxococcaceae bacterium]|nr:DUF2236 domain-containing protein [Myxococcaceae bacterium]
MEHLAVRAARRAVERAARVLRSTQRADGSWEGPCDMGPSTTAQAVVALARLKRLSPEDAASAARWLRAQQRPDGSYPLYPSARVGHLGATASAWAALHLTAPGESAEAIARARAWVDRHGGLQGVVEGIELGDLSALFLAMAGLLDPQRLPRPNIAFLGVPPVVKVVRTRLNSAVLLTAFELATLSRTLRSEPLSAGDRLAQAAGLELLTTFQNADGSWNDSVVISTLALLTLAEVCGPNDRRVQRGLQWFEAQAVRGPSGLHFNGFGSEVWATAFDVRALLDAGVPPADPAVARALDWLASAQSLTPMPAFDNRKPNAVLTGGWAFQRTNPTMVDTDDTGVVLSAIGAAQRWSGPGALAGELEARLERTVRRAHDWLLDMQNPDGGWAAFIWGLPSKRPGPAMSETVRVKLDDPLAMARLFIDPPPPLGDPSTEDVTARVLHGLGATGFSVRSEPVARALEFLQRQQCQSGAFWGRWVLNYLSCTAFVLMGLKSVGADRDAHWVRRAVSWVLSKQNPDGGWGETPASYRDEGQAGVGPSMPPLTALVLKGLLDLGERSSAIDRAVEYLVRTQHPDGGWPNHDYLHVNIAPDTFFLYAEATRFYPPAALGTWLRRAQAAATLPPRFSAPQLEAMRAVGDPEADQVVRAVFSSGEAGAVNRLLGRLFTADGPLPPELPDVVEQYFAAHRALPSWVDPVRLKLAQELFARHGWLVAAGLFASSLPQAYCAAKGARVLMQSQRMSSHVRQRVFETAQFLFDVCDVGAFEAGGRAVASTLKVRLMHAAIRHLIAQHPQGWDAAALGVPVNQEDLAGTLMTFSVVILDALPKLGVQLTDAEAEAWLHLWQVTGHLLGVRPELVPRDVADGVQLMELIRARQWARSDDGVVLGRALVELMQEALPGPLVDGLPVALIRRLAGDHAADLLGLPKADWTTVVLNAGSALDALFDLDDELARSAVLAGCSQRLMQAVVLFEREGKRARFRMPVALPKA